MRRLGPTTVLVTMLRLFDRRRCHHERPCEDSKRARRAAASGVHRPADKECTYKQSELEDEATWPNFLIGAVIGGLLDAVLVIAVVGAAKAKGTTY